MKRLIAYLRENMILDFQGDLTMEMIVLADILIDQVRNSVSDEQLREQLRMYAES